MVISLENRQSKRYPVVKKYFIICIELSRTPYVRNSLNKFNTKYLTLMNHLVTFICIHNLFKKNSPRLPTGVMHAHNITFSKHCPEKFDNGVKQISQRNNTWRQKWLTVIGMEWKRRV